MEILEFCKRDFGERSNSSLERALRGEEDGVVGGGQGAVGGGGYGGEALEVNGFLGGKEEEEDDGDGVVVVGMVEEMEERKVEELEMKVVEELEKVAGHGKARGCFYGCHLLAGNKEGEEENMKEREEESGVYI